MGLSAGLCPLPASYPYREVGNLKVRHSRWQIVSRETQREQSELGERSGWSGRARQVCTASRSGSDGELPDDWARPEQVISFLSADGIVQFPISQSGRRALSQRRSQRPLAAPLPTWEEQGLCIGATFFVAATNGHDPTRRINVLGYCRSVDMLSEVVEDSVLSSGGEVMRRERELRSMHETLRMTVAIPFLFGVPPAYEMLSDAIRLGGGIVDRVSRQWQMY